MTAITITRLYELLSAKLGKENAENLTTFIESKINQEMESRIQNLATKEDIANLDIKIEATKSEIIKWSFIFWISQLLATFGFILLFIKK